MHSKIRGCTLKADPHIKSKHLFFKDKFLAQLELKNVSDFRWDDFRGCVFVDDDMFAEYVKHHPKARGLNKKALPYWDQLCLIFGKSRALGADVVHIADAVSVFQCDISMDDATDLPELPYSMEDYGLDLHATGLHPPPPPPTSATENTIARKGKQPATSSGQKRSRKNVNDAYFQGLQSRFDKFEDNLGNTCVNIEQIANTFCKDDNLFEIRMSLFDELSRQQVLQATRKLMNDDDEAATYFRMRTEAKKVEYILFML
ncbi:hypothetical protein LINPERHAP1_LOCUS15583 [Linum perenne]